MGGLFKWAFGVDDTVKDSEGKRGRVQRFRPEGMVDVKDEESGKTKTRFGGTLEKEEE